LQLHFQKVGQSPETTPNECTEALNNIFAEKKQTFAFVILKFMLDHQEYEKLGKKQQSGLACHF
jgi:hypothetical protein